MQSYAKSTIETQTVWDALTAGHNLPLYGIADGAMSPYIYAHLQAYEVPYLALYKNKDLPDENCPLLFPLKPQETFSEWYLQESLSQYWGILLTTPLPLARLAEHLQAFITMQDEQGKLYLMRFYDPRVIKAFFDALSLEQMQGFFKPGLHLWADALGFPQVLQQYQIKHGQQIQGQPIPVNQLKPVRTINAPGQPQNDYYSIQTIDLRLKTQVCEGEACSC